jgi:hypothetical protein
LRHCIDPCTSDLAGNPFQFGIFGFMVTTADPSCAPDCLYWGTVLGGGGGLGFGIDNCVLVVTAQVVAGPCGPC